MSHSHDHGHDAIKLGFSIAKLALKTAMVCAAFMTAKEIHRVHKAIEAKK